MNRFAKIEHVDSFEKVTFYTVRFSEDEQSLFETFLSKHKERNTEEELRIIMSWIERIGNKIGATLSFKNAGKNLFRHEEKAFALPPEFIGSKLRLYCHVLNSSVVFLFNGGVKTTKYAQDCPNVASHFKMANSLASEIDVNLRSGEISWNNDFTDIVFDENFELEL